MEEKKDLGFLGSSTDSAKISATVSGAIISVSSFIIAYAASKGVSITEAQVVYSAGQLGMAVGSIYFLIGLVRKLIVKVAKK